MTKEERECMFLALETLEDMRYTIVLYGSSKQIAATDVAIARAKEILK